MNHYSMIRQGRVLFFLLMELGIATQGGRMEDENLYTHRRIFRWLILVEIIGFIVVAAFLWVDELLDLPHRIFNTPPTPINFSESLIESCLVIVLGAVMVLITALFLRRIRYLEGFHIVCASCRRVLVNDDWMQLEAWVSNKTDAHFSHGLCPTCRASVEEELEQMEKEVNQPECRQYLRRDEDRAS